MNFEEEKKLLSQFIYELDPCNMKQYEDPTIYQKEASTIIKSKSIEIKDIKNIFISSFSVTYDDNKLDQLVLHIREYLYKRKII